ncbi:S-acyl fatty acid synthase thioesterase, medium chain-like [Littorina saxatilis]|uniref:S-acyl fatty acid synthase thioesterase, medium chain n=1 Tax=Littorina saxatilis TaxID=31220 RepID=A0AAN9BSE2_9CAEN
MASQSPMNCRFPRPDATHRLICFPWAGGGSNFYAAWGKDLAPNIEVHGITLRGRESRFREELCTSPQETLTEIASTIANELGDKPFIFFGHSLGSLLSYETAVLLRKKYSRQPEHMYLSGGSAPHSDNRRKKTTDPADVTDEEFLKHLKKLGGMPPEILANQEVLSLFLPALKADFTIATRIQYDPSNVPPLLPCDFTFFDGVDDDDHDYPKWKELTEGSFTLHRLPGDHFYLKDTDNQKKMLTCIQGDFPS